MIATVPPANQPQRARRAVGARAAAGSATIGDSVPSKSSAISARRLADQRGQPGPAPSVPDRQAHRPAARRGAHPVPPARCRRSRSHQGRIELHRLRAVDQLV
jgi:hypothetical protein